ncbi:MAG: OmpA family protein [Barnesiella sp.]
MKKMKFVSVLLAMCLVFGSCNMSNTGKGALIGGGSGAAVGAGLGAIFGKGKGAAIGAAVGAAVGTTAGVLIGKKMDKARAEAAALEGAKAEDVTDANGLQAVKVTFDSGILFAFNSSTLSQTSKNSLRDFSKILIKNPTMDVAIYGHTDNIGTEAANMKVSTARANVVESYLMSCGVPVSQIKITEGKGYTEPVASNETKAGQAQNRRVEVYLYASEAMIKEAETGTLK